MLQLLREVEQFSGCRDRDRLAARLVASVHGLFSAQSVRLLRAIRPGPDCLCEVVAQADAHGVRIARANDPASEPEPRTDPHLCESLRKSRPVWMDRPDGRTGVAFPIPDAGSTLPLILEIDAIAAQGADVREALEHFVRIYSNYIGLLDYSERDTLTGLLNRKTFDDAFDRLLQPALAGAAALAAERRQESSGPGQRWIGVIDIDHFKRVNDRFGHLFGDEVLLRVANVIKQSFRGTDRLFRFGGEEFVVMLQPTPENYARQVFDRFRSAVEAHEFPQVGQVTCSVGYTSVDQSLAPTDILGRADQALYYAKNNGRNQTRAFDTLVETGAIATPQRVDTSTEIDIDALFA